MDIKINHKDYRVPEQCSLSEAIIAAGLSTSGIAVAINNEVVKVKDFDSTIINDGDNITIIKAFYGG